MKLKSLFLGTIAAAGLSTAGFAADLGVLTSLDVCDALGISGLTISSDTNCLQISGSVDYRLRFGNFRGGNNVGDTAFGNVDPFGADQVVDINGVVRDLDWDTRVRAYLKAVAASSTDFGTAKAIIGLRQVDEWRVRNEGYAAGGAAAGATAGGDNTNGLQLEEAYVSVGDSTVLMAGLRKRGAAGSVANVGDDSPFSFLFMSDKVDGGGVLIESDDRRLGGHSIQMSTDLGNGLSASLGLESIDSGLGSNDQNTSTTRTNAESAGTLIGVLQYGGESISAHVTGLAYGILDGNVEAYAVHAGVTGTFDMFKVRAAVGYDSNFYSTKTSAYTNYSLVNALASVEASFDMFKVAVSGEVANFNNQTDYSIGARVTAQVTDGVSINFDAAWFRDAVNPNALGAQTDTTRLQAEIAASVTETITLTAALGGYFGSGVYSTDRNAGPGAALVAVDHLYFGKAGVKWAPGTGFETAANLEINSQGGYRTEFTAKKSFE
ncbi:hypothetical protein VW29_05420 [Devosia limi DSM 17137]|uniref:Porin n=1 Tax=Devosia limi DSM 17137 TaxID=1121477 RepID=A0A0F5LUB3_9HYPH|nr:hypothetical protein [Devosia limi]KKB85739.1 hypothetical protein VW29_05420 [Devosia limi DSM 17137]SHE30723.1 hypothetical protein SAMN02745223_00017 [Devosia limi DSM 17137]